MIGGKGVLVVLWNRCGGWLGFRGCKCGLLHSSADINPGLRVPSRAKGTQFHNVGYACSVKCSPLVKGFGNCWRE